MRRMEDAALWEWDKYGGSVRRQLVDTKQTSMTVATLDAKLEQRRGIFLYGTYIHVNTQGH